MRDKRESTHANASEAGVEDVLAGRLPKVLGDRLRTARNAVGLSQGAVAKAMNERGFSWRQTTVAKSEAADRPVLFAEVAALSQLYRRDLEYFLYPGAGLDDVLDRSITELEGITGSIGDAYNHIRALESDQRLYQCTVGLASSVVRYRNTSDSGVLLADLRELLSQHHRKVLLIDEVYEAVNLTAEQACEIDKMALQEVATVEMEGYSRLSEDDLKYESPDLLNGLSDFLEGKPVTDSLLEVLRQGTDWPSLVAVPLADLLMDAVHRQQSGS